MSSLIKKMMMAVAVLLLMAPAGCALTGSEDSTTPEASSGDSTGLTQTAGTGRDSDKTGTVTSRSDDAASEDGEEQLVLGDNLSLEDDVFEEKQDSPHYSIKTTRPVLTGSDDSRVEQFNSLVEDIFDSEIATFTDGVSTWQTPVSGNGSSLEIKYALKSPPGTIVSLTFSTYTYMEGAAHPNQTEQTLNFDLEKGEVISLADVFKNGSDYLQLLSSYCTAELSRKGYLDFPEGAEPTEENYSVWALTGDGIEITFNAYQVAPYAVGIQRVSVPYDNLRLSLNVAGPAARIMQ